jgi:calmodulin
MPRSSKVAVCPPEDADDASATREAMTGGGTSSLTLDQLGEPFREQLGDEQFEEYKRVFQDMDTDGSGAISRAELRTALRAACDADADAAASGRPPRRVTDAELEAMVSRADADGNGEVDFDEFLLMMQHQEAREGNPTHL